MAVECISMAIPLIVLSLFLNSSAVPGSGNDSEQANCFTAIGKFLASLQMTYSQTNQSSILTNIVTGIGAGIYEELIFRLILI